MARVRNDGPNRNASTSAGRTVEEICQDIATLPDEERRRLWRMLGVDPPEERNRAAWVLLGRLVKAEQRLSRGRPDLAARNAEVVRRYYDEGQPVKRIVKEMGLKSQELARKILQRSGRGRRPRDR